MTVIQTNERNTLMETFDNQLNST